VAAPTPLIATRSSRDLDVPRNPDGRTVGFDIFIPHRSVLRFGVVIFLDRTYRISKKLKHTLQSMLKEYTKRP